MKKLIALILSAVLLLSLTACSSDNTQSGSNADSGDISVVETIPETDIKGIAVNKIDEDEDWIINESDNTAYMVPKININTDNIAKLNDTLHKKYDEMRKKDNASGYRASYFKTAKYGSVISLFITSYTVEKTIEYEIYNISLTDGTLVDDAKLVNYCRLTSSAYKNGLKAGLEYVYKTYYGSFSDSEPVTYEKYLNLTVADKNIKDVQLYIATGSTLSAVGKIYGFDGTTDKVVCEVAMLEDIENEDI